MFVVQLSSLSPASCLKHTLSTARKLPDSTPNSLPGVLSGDSCMSLFTCISLVVGPARLSVQCFGKSWSGSDGIWWRLEHTLPLPSKYAVQLSSLSPASCLKHTPSTARKLPENTPNSLPGVLSGDSCMSLSHPFLWRSDQLCCRFNVLGKVGRAQMEFGGG